MAVFGVPFDANRRHVLGGDVVGVKGEPFLNLESENPGTKIVDNMNVYVSCNKLIDYVW